MRIGYYCHLNLTSLDFIAILKVTWFSLETCPLDLSISIKIYISCWRFRWWRGDRIPCIYIASFVWTSTKNAWNAQNAIWSRASGPGFYHSSCDHAWFDILSRETYALHNVGGAEAFFFPSNFDSIILTRTFASNVLHVLLANAPSSKKSDIPFTTAFTKNIQTVRN